MAKAIHRRIAAVRRQTGDAMYMAEQARLSLLHVAAERQAIADDLNEMVRDLTALRDDSEAQGEAAYAQAERILLS